LFSKVIWPLKEQRPNWSGFMQLYNKEEHDTDLNVHPDAVHVGVSAARILAQQTMKIFECECLSSN